MKKRDKKEGQSAKPRKHHVFGEPPREDEWWWKDREHLDQMLHWIEEENWDFEALLTDLRRSGEPEVLDLADTLSRRRLELDGGAESLAKSALLDASTPLWAKATQNRSKSISLALLQMWRRPWDDEPFRTEVLEQIQDHTRKIDEILKQRTRSERARTRRKTPNKSKRRG